MNSVKYIPCDARTAGQQLQAGLAASLPDMSKLDFLRVWHSIAYLYPGLHPDGFEDKASGWPASLRPFGSEAWRRANAGQLSRQQGQT